MSEPVSEPTEVRPGRAIVAMVRLALRADPGRTVLLMASGLLSGALVTVNLSLTARLLDSVLGGRAGQTLVLAGIAGALSTVHYALAILTLDLRFRMEETLRSKVDVDLIETLSTRAGLEHYERPDLVDQLQILRQQRGMIGSTIAALFENLGLFAQLVTMLGVLASISPALLTVPASGLIALAGGLLNQRWIRRSEEAIAPDARLAASLVSAATDPAMGKEVRVFGLADTLIDRWAAADRLVQRRSDRLQLAGTAVNLVGNASFAVALAWSMTTVVTLTLDGRLSPGRVVLALTTAAGVRGALSGIAGMLEWLLSSARVAGRYLAVCEAAAGPAACAPASVAEASSPIGGIRLDGVRFAYPGTSGEVLRGVDLHIPPGTSVALVGENGAGKTTLVKLLCGFYAPSAGRIIVDGVDLATIPTGEWRERVSAGFQDAARFNFLAGENVGVGWLESLTDPAAVTDAIDRAGASDVIATLPSGLDSQLGRSFDGVELSGGQWQKLGMARALMRPEPAVLLLDEPAAALDADAEHALVSRQLGEARAAARATGAITLLVSHRFASVRLADLIVVMTDGVVSEAGSHEDLLALGGTYAELFELQARAYR